MDAFQIKAVNHVLHRNVAGKIPVLDIHCRIPLTVLLWKHMEKNTVQQAVQINTVHLLRPFFEQLHQFFRLIIQHVSIRSHRMYAHLPYKRKGRQRTVQKPHVQIQLVPCSGQDILANGLCRKGPLLGIVNGIYLKCS